jgi:hypothetical protein
MAKKARADSAKTRKASKKAVAKKAVAKKAVKKDGRLATTAKRAGRTLGRAAKGADRTTAALKKAASGKPGKKKPGIDPEVEATRARNRAMWKSQAQEANSVELAKQAALVDERARVRSTMGMSWSNRKPR